MKFRRIEIEYEKYGTEKGKYHCQICFDVNEDISVYAKVNEVVTAELINVLIPVFEKITNKKFEDVKEETETFLSSFRYNKRS